ncbi:MAG TPA: universal stress protein [Solirubrobacteraceae bacterium]|nr:universal stress protein [Solirubrobacteraceae bacterium]
MKTIMLAYDGEPASQPALERAAELAKALAARLIVTSVAPVQIGGPRTAGPLEPGSLEEHARELADARSYLEGLGVQAEYIEATGEPANAIVTLADEHQAEMIIVGTHGRNLVERLLGQSVSEAVARKASVDVLIAH